MQTLGVRQCAMSDTLPGLLILLNLEDHSDDGCAHLIGIHASRLQMPEERLDILTQQVGQIEQYVMAR